MHPKHQEGGSEWTAAIYRGLHFRNGMDNGECAWGDGNTWGSLPAWRVEGGGKNNTEMGTESESYQGLRDRGDRQVHGCISHMMHDWHEYMTICGNLDSDNKLSHHRLSSSDCLMVRPLLGKDRMIVYENGSLYSILYSICRTLSRITLSIDLGLTGSSGEMHQRQGLASDEKASLESDG